MLGPRRLRFATLATRSRHGVQALQVVGRMKQGCGDSFGDAGEDIVVNHNVVKPGLVRFKGRP